MRHGSRGFLSDQNGAALIEFTLLIPILFGLVFGLIEFSRATYQHHVAEKGVKAAARYIARAPAPDPCNPAGTAYTNAVADAKTLAVNGSLESNADASLSNWSDSDISVGLSTISNAPAAGVRPWRGQCDQLYVVSVSTSFDYDDLGLLSLIGVSSLTIQASHQEVFIGD